MRVGDKFFMVNWREIFYGKFHLGKTSPWEI